MAKKQNSDECAGGRAVSEKEQTDFGVEKVDMKEAAGTSASHESNHGAWEHQAMPKEGKAKK